MSLSSSLLSLKCPFSEYTEGKSPRYTKEVLSSLDITFDVLLTASLDDFFLPPNPILRKNSDHDHAFEADPIYTLQTKKLRLVIASHLLGREFSVPALPIKEEHLHAFKENHTTI